MFTTIFWFKLETLHKNEGRVDTHQPWFLSNKSPMNGPTELTDPEKTLSIDQSSVSQFTFHGVPTGFGPMNNFWMEFGVSKFHTTGAVFPYIPQIYGLRLAISRPFHSPLRPRVKTQPFLGRESFLQSKWSDLAIG